MTLDLLSPSRLVTNKVSRPSTKYWILENVRRLLEAFLSCSFPLFCESVTKVLEYLVEYVKACGFAKSGRIIKIEALKV